MIYPKPHSIYLRGTIPRRVPGIDLKHDIGSYLTEDYEGTREQIKFGL